MLLKSLLLGKLRPLKKRERPFESRLRAELWRRHGVKFFKIKPTWTGLPDRMAMGKGASCLVELKRESEVLDDAQYIMHQLIYKMSGREVLTIHGPDVHAARIVIVKHLISLASS